MSPYGGSPEIRWDEYEHAAGFGWSLDRIAEFLGVHPGSLKVALDRRAARERQGENARRGEAA